MLEAQPNRSSSSSGLVSLLKDVRDITLAVTVLGLYGACHYAKELAKATYFSATRREYQWIDGEEDQQHPSSFSRVVPK